MTLGREIEPVQPTTWGLAPGSKTKEQIDLGKLRRERDSLRAEVEMPTPSEAELREWAILTHPALTDRAEKQRNLAQIEAELVKYGDHPE